MRSRSLPVTAPLALLGLAALAPGCAKGTNHRLPTSDQRPTVGPKAAPVGVAGTAFHSSDIQWTGRDPDGSVARDCVVDPPTEPGADTARVATTATHQQIRFQVMQPYWDPVNGWRSGGHHAFVIRAVDDRRLVSAVVARAFRAARGFAGWDSVGRETTG